MAGDSAEKKRLSSVYDLLYPSGNVSDSPRIVPFRIGRGKIVAVGGGKGGIGKSVITANLGIVFAGEGREVVLVDGDLGGANLHTALGISPPEVGLSDFVSGKVSRLEEVITATSYSKLSLINGARDPVGIGNLKYLQKRKLLEHIGRLKGEIVLLDLGGGTSFNTLDFFLASDLGLIVVTPEPTSIENAYRFIRAAVMRRVRSVVSSTAARELLDACISASGGECVDAPKVVFDRIKRVDRASFETIEMALARLRFAIIFNMLRDDGDYRIGEAMSKACMAYFGMKIPFLGGVPYDDSVWRSVRLKKPFFEVFPSASPSINIRHIADEIHRRLFDKGL